MMLVKSIPAATMSCAAPIRVECAPNRNDGHASSEAMLIARPIRCSVRATS
jgi:hypothetical protein